MKILIFNWRDIKNPKSGGAEILTHEIAERWVKNNNSVTIFTSLYEGAKKEEIINGVKIIRRGHPDARFLFWSVHFLALLYYFRFFKGKYDVVIDEIHGVPFFSPLYIREKKVALICEVADDLWVKLYGRIFGSIGRLVEIIYLRGFYRRMDFLTISASTKNALLQNGVGEENIHIMPMGITFPKEVPHFKKERNLTALYVGRLSKQKGVEDALAALKHIIIRVPSATLWIVGRGEKMYTNTLLSMTKKLGLSKNVIFWGFVSEPKKFELMQKAHVLVSPSQKEGFGLVIIEAGMVGTPAVVYNSLGLSEVVYNNKTGLVCQANNPEVLSLAILKLFNDKKLYERISQNAKKASESFNWKRTADFSLSVLNSL